MRAPAVRIHLDRELIVDNFAGGGGASAGLHAALGRAPDIAVNHDPEAIAMHEANHPSTRHFCEDVWKVDPTEATNGRPVGLAWFSPDCCHFSRAKGEKPVAKEIRGLAWVVIRWARAVHPRIIVVENVEEFQTWGPLVGDRPDPRRAGLTFRRWVGNLRGAGYTVEWRTMVAADFGAPTTRKRLYLVARCDGLPIRWPEPTHGKGLVHRWRPASEIIDWTLPVPSIFERERGELAQKTLDRIAEGMRRYVLEAPQPFIVRAAGADAVPTLITRSWGERCGQAPRVPGLDKPLGTLVAGGVKHALVAGFLSKHFGGVVGHGLQRPIGTVTAKDHHSLTTATLAPPRAPRSKQVRAFLTSYYGNGARQRGDLQAPLATVTARDRFGLVACAGELYEISDIGMRMLAPRELYRAQGFPESYAIDFGPRGEPLSKSAQVRMAGNSVCPPVAEAIVRANIGAEEGATTKETRGHGTPRLF